MAFAEPCRVNSGCNEKESLWGSRSMSSVFSEFSPASSKERNYSLERVAIRDLLWRPCIMKSHKYCKHPNRTETRGLESVLFVLGNSFPLRTVLKNVSTLFQNLPLRFRDVDARGRTVVGGITRKRRRMTKLKPLLRTNEDPMERARIGVDVLYRVVNICRARQWVVYSKVASGNPDPNSPTQPNPKPRSTMSQFSSKLRSGVCVYRALRL